jgi:undecaprenyl-diphosphatase
METAITSILLAFIQAATEFLPISSSGHLALFSQILGKESSLFFFVVLHFASLLAVIIFVRKEILGLLSFRKEYRKLWIYLIIGTLPAAIVGLLFNDLVEQMFSSLLFLSGAFIFTGIILLSTKTLNTNKNEKLSNKKSLIIGLFQILALFPGISRSGMTISSALFQGIDREKVARFSFLLFIPLSIGALFLETVRLESVTINSTLIISFFVTLIFSILFLNLLVKILKAGKFWVFGVYCLILGIITLIIYLF